MSLEKLILKELKKIRILYRNEKNIYLIKYIYPNMEIIYQK
jgi:hypothetical protein